MVLWTWAVEGLLAAWEPLLVLLAHWAFWVVFLVPWIWLLALLAHGSLRWLHGCWHLPGPFLE